MTLDSRVTAAKLAPRTAVEILKGMRASGPQSCRKGLHPALSADSSREGRCPRQGRGSRPECAETLHTRGRPHVPQGPPNVRSSWKEA